MPNPDSLKDRLRQAGIRHYDELIHDQPKEWLIENFQQGATDYPVNVARLMCNIIWQTRERIVNKEKPPLKELLRTFWYMYIKPTLSRAGALVQETDQYAQLIDKQTKPPTKPQYKGHIQSLNFYVPHFSLSG